MKGAATLRTFHPLVRAWFTETLGAPSEPQRQGWPAIASGAHTLILAPTGTGKTLAAFLWELNALIVDGAESPLPNTIRILYVSPLKALNNDIQRNLEHPLAELRQRFERAGEAFPTFASPYAPGILPQPPVRGCCERGALLVMREGRIGMAVEGRGRRITIAPWMADADVTAAATALLAHLRASGSPGRRPREVEVETIDRVNAAAAKWTEAFLKAGFRRETAGLRGF